MNTKILHRFSIALALATFVLIFSGGLVTSKGVGMSVPDWPTTYGYNMFLFPFSKWIGGIFWEHLHRLIASTVGFLTVILCAWLCIKERRGWLKHVGVIAFLAVATQGWLGAQRVLMNRADIGIFHACLAQSFFLLTTFIALVTSNWWKTNNLARDPAKNFTKIALFLTVLIFINMAVAATMRHAHAGLSIPDFPTAYGKVLPPLDDMSLDKINTARIAQNVPETSATLISLQYIHRLIAYFLGFAIPWLSYRIFQSGSVLKKWMPVWSGLVLVQILLGAWTIWSNKAADIATAHVAIGACLLVLSGLVTIISCRSQWDARQKMATASSKAESQPELAHFS